ncbi:MAG: acyl--CoA ligase [Lachnospiraceae bacterium]|nr:acyl--CoA ligase [Lachnospiraceae bacterium]
MRKMRVFLGTQEIGKSEIEKILKDMECELKWYGAKEGNMVLCRSKTQLGNVLQWWLCKRMNLLPIFVAPDFRIANHKAIQHYSVRFVIDIDQKNQFTIHKNSCLKQTVSLDIPSGSIVQMTSATTGEAKMVLRTADTIVAETRRYQQFMKFEEQDRFITMAPFYHSYAFFCVLLMCEMVSADLILPDIILPRRIIELSKQTQATCLYAIPYFLQKMVEVEQYSELGNNMRYVMSTSQKIPEQLAVEFQKKFGVSMFHQYGSTETGCVAIGNVLKEQEFVTPLSEVVFFEKSNLLSQKVLCVDTKKTLGCYLTEKGIQKLGDENGFYMTNDKAKFREDGTAKLMGRADRVLIRAGEKINGSYVEKILMRFPGIKKAAVSLNEKNQLVCKYEAKQECAFKELKKTLRKIFITLSDTRTIHF